MPVSKIQARCERDVRHKLLQIVYQYGRVTQRGLDDFILEGKLDFSLLAREISIPNVFIDENKDWNELELEIPRVKARTKPGELWLLDDHRLLCGDSASEEDVDRLLAGARIHLVNTDPPYNVRVEPRSTVGILTRSSSFTKPIKMGKNKRIRPKDRLLVGDDVSDAKYAENLRLWFGNIGRALIPGRAFYIWGGWSNIKNYPLALEEAGLFFAQQIIWVKEHPVLTRKDFMGNHEWCFYGWRKGKAHKFYGPNNAPDVWSIKKITQSKMEHLTEKPLELAMNAIKYSSKPGENVLDLFGGAGFTLLAAERINQEIVQNSGSTLIAAEQMNRRAFLMEIDPLYCDIIIARWEPFSGKKAEREGKPPAKE